MNQRHRRALLIFWAFLPLVLVSLAAFAQTVTSTVAEPTPVELFAAGEKVFRDWMSAGALAGVIALVKLFVDVTKLKVVDNWLWDHQWRWVRPILALLLGGLMQLAAAIPLKGNLVLAFIYGVLAGASSIGINELVGMFAAVKEKKAEEAPTIAAYKAGSR